MGIGLTRKFEFHLYFLVVTDANGCTWSNYFKVPLRDEFSGGPSIRRPGYGSGGITVSPNPFSRELEVQLSGINEGLEVRLLLYDFAGQLVYEKQVLGFRHRRRPGCTGWWPSRRESV